MENYKDSICFSTDRLDLRVLLPEDIDEIYDYYISNQDSFAGVIPYHRYPFDHEFTLSLLNAELSDFLASKSIRFYIFYHGGSEILGDFSLFDIRRGLFDSASLGFKLRKEYRGQHIMREALEFAIGYAFSTLKLHRLEIQTSVANSCAIALAERLLFERVGLVRGFIRISQDWEDYYLYSRLSDQ